MNALDISQIIANYSTVVATAAAVAAVWVTVRPSKSDKKIRLPISGKKGLAAMTSDFKKANEYRFSDANGKEKSSDKPQTTSKKNLLAGIGKIRSQICTRFAHEADSSSKRNLECWESLGIVGFEKNPAC